MKDYLKLLQFVKPYKLLFLGAIICMGFSAVFDGVSLAMMVPLADKVLTNKKIIVPTKLPDFLAGFVDKINNTPPEVLLNYMVVIVLLLFLFKGIFGFYQSYFMSDIGQRVIRDIRSRLYAKIQSLSLNYFTHKRGGELMSRITNDVKLVENAVSYGSTDLIYQSLQIVIFAVVIFFIYFKMALIAFVFLPLISYPIVRMGKILRKLSKRSQEKIADTNSLLYETIMGARVVKAFNMEGYEVSRFNRVNSDYYKISMKTIKRSLLLNPITEFLGVVAGVLVFFWGGREVMSGKVSFGVFGLFLGSLLSLIRPFKKLSAVNALNQQAMAASERIHEVLETETSVKEQLLPKILSEFKKNIKFNDIWFSYADTQILKGVNLSIEYGQMLAIVGPSGSGKSTLVDLIPRFYDPQKGEILIDGVNIQELSLKSLRSQIGIVNQETMLFNDTIRANIAYGRLNATASEIEEAAKKAHAHEFILNCPQGYDTIIGDRGVMISGGERQRIAIARALLKNAPILILDEATSQLDSTSERIVQAALDHLVSGRTVFVVAHRLSTVRNANRIVVIDKGMIVEQGTHSQLLEKGGLYKRLYEAQELQK
ncbi:MAG TPA: ABC transporter ATP-binding protein [Candidatus Omnitrophota bacterium]|nr:ABC transporter ATP-binding protein [Candidatus Omnitrophota bacterium]HPT39020.1 ABC transporter ATP-binding protein [Candidatus Omnitrophota bacterium]